MQGNLLLVDPKRKRVDIALALRSRGICFFELRAARIFFNDLFCARQFVGRTREDVLTKRLPCAQGGFVFSRSELRAFFFMTVFCARQFVRRNTWGLFFFGHVQFHLNLVCSRPSCAEDHSDRNLVCGRPSCAQECFF